MELWVHKFKPQLDQILERERERETFLRTQCENAAFEKESGGKVAFEEESGGVVLERERLEWLCRGVGAGNCRGGSQELGRSFGGDREREVV